jgi:hypothetical protein
MCGSSSSSPSASFERLWGWFGPEAHERRWRPWFQQPVRRGSTAITLDTDGKFARFGVGDTGVVAKQKGRQQSPPKKKKMSRKAKVNQLKWYRLKAKKKMKSPNPEVRIRYKLEKV